MGKQILQPEAMERSPDVEIMNLGDAKCKRFKDDPALLNALRCLLQKRDESCCRVHMLLSRRAFLLFRMSRARCSSVLRLL